MFLEMFWKGKWRLTYLIVQVYISEAGFAAEESRREEWDTTRYWNGYRCDGLMSRHMPLPFILNLPRDGDVVIV